MNLILLSLCTVSIFGNFASSDAITDREKPNYRLNSDIEPLHYVIDVTPFFNDSNVPGKEPFTFDGVTSITIRTSKSNIDTITLHKLNLNIVEQSLTKKSTMFAKLPLKVEQIIIKSNEYDNRTEKYTLKLASTLVKGELYVLTFKYTGSLINKQGFYRTAYKEGNVTKYMASTHMEPANARKMFPCFDEPRLKATFSVIVNRPAYFKPSISNMPMISSHYTSTNLIREYFEKSPKMSTYLVAVVVSEFECRENPSKNFSICFQPSAFEQSEYSYTFGQKMLKTFDDLFDYPYNTHMPKISFAAVPFFGGGMENWGAIIYGDTSILMDPKSYMPKKQQSIGGLIAHELAHMWFGDLVTCNWWANTWLNEGFASYFQTFGLALLEPDWNVDQQFIVDSIQTVFPADSVESALPLNYDANTSEELHAKFGSITYTKGASVIRMFSHILGNDKFILGLRNYLKQNALKTAVPEKLYAAFQKEVKNEFNVAEIFDSWVSQPGFPVLNVNIASNRKQIEIRQKRFLESNPNHEDKTQYNVPLTWASNIENSDFSNTKPTAMLLNSSLQIELKKPIDWIVFNVQQSGYYRVNYDDNTWSSIAQILHKSYSTVHNLNRGQIIDDALMLARSSYSSYKTAFEVVDYLQNEIDYVPWKAALRNFDFIFARLKPNEAQLFQKFETKLLNKVYEHLGFYSKGTDKHLDIYNRDLVVKNACQAGLKQCIDDARNAFDNSIRRDYSNLRNDLASVVYCSVIENGSDEEWNFLWNKFKSTNLDDERKITLNALGCVRRVDLMKKYLELILSNEIQLKNKHDALVSTLTKKQNLRLVLDFVISKHKAIDDAFETKEEVPAILSNIATSSTTDEEIYRIEKFVQENGLDSKENVKTALKDAKLNLKWASQNVPIIMDTIKKLL